MKISKYLFIWVCACIPMLLSAQEARVLTAEGTYSFYYNSNISFEQAKADAYKRGQIELISHHFGVGVQEVNTMRTKSVDGKSSTEFSSISSSEIGGEWIEDLSVPKYSAPKFKEDMTGYTITVTLKGRIREIVSNKCDLDVKVIRVSEKNGVTQESESDVFFSGEDFYVMFKSPVKGYLVMYLTDEQGDAYCLRPYRNMERDIFMINPRENYIFFKSHSTAYYYDENMPYTLNTNVSGSDVEYNSIHVLFSPNLFYEPEYEVDDSGEPIVRHQEFRSWLAKCKYKDPHFQEVVKEVTIKPN